jgi:DNA repair protein RecO (recombination protein O)
MVIRHAEAIIVRSRDYGEADRLITFFTRNHGQLTGIAKGARRSRKRFVNTLEPLSYVLLTYAERTTAGLVRIDASELRDPFTSLRGDVSRLAYASLGCEMIMHLAPERQANPLLFSLLHHYLQRLEQTTDPENTALLFQIRALCLGGYAPNLQACLRCGREVQAGEAWFFSVAEGGLLCEIHARGSSTHPVSPGGLFLLRQAQHLSLDRLWRLRFHVRCREECRVLLLDLIRHHLERDLKSLILLRQLDALNPSQ